jgi:hypothetical protein
MITDLFGRAFAGGEKNEFWALPLAQECGPAAKDERDQKQRGPTGTYQPPHHAEGDDPR